MRVHLLRMAAMVQCKFLSYFNACRRLVETAWLEWLSIFSNCLYSSYIHMWFWFAFLTFQYFHIRCLLLTLALTSVKSRWFLSQRIVVHIGRPWTTGCRHRNSLFVFFLSIQPYDAIHCFRSEVLFRRIMLLQPLSGLFSVYPMELLPWKISDHSGSTVNSPNNENCSYMRLYCRSHSSISWIIAWKCAKS